MKKYVTWQEVDDFVEEVIKRYADKKVTGVYGLPRGGLVFAVMISHRLGVPMLASPVAGCIIVDDICDSGESLLHYVKNTSGEDQQKYHIVTMYKKDNELGIVPDFSKFDKGDAWIVFPWEEKEPFGGLMGNGGHYVFCK